MTGPTKISLPTHPKMHKPVGLTRFAWAKFPYLRCRPMAILRIAPKLFAFMEFDPATDLRKVVQVEVRNYKLVKEA